MTIAVFGSINMDLVARTPRLPLPGETLIGHAFDTLPGGKGANQAVACARLGATVWMIGRVGGDVFGETLINGLRENQVGTEGIRIDQEAASGVAIIAVDDQAENTIIVVSGANARVDGADVEQLSHILPNLKVLLLQLEVPIEMSMQAAGLARDNHATVILDPAPAQKLPAEIYPLVDVLTPNETEAAALVGYPIEDVSAAARAADELRGRGVGQVIIKMGALGAYSDSTAGGQLFRSFPVEAIDTVAAGDAFNGGLAVALSEGLDVEEAVNWGVAAGGLAVTRHGAQTAMPARAELLELLSENRN